MQEIKKNITIPRYQGNYFCYKGKIIILLYQSKYDESIALVKKKKKKLVIIILLFKNKVHLGKYCQFIIFKLLLPGKLLVKDHALLK